MGRKDKRYSWGFHPCGVLEARNNTRFLAVNILNKIRNAFVFSMS